MALHSERAGDGPPMVLLHGFGQTARCWGPVADEVARDHRVIRVDAPGHGGSSEVEADLPTTARLVAATGGRGVYLGYSMGARMALHVALRAPEAVEALVLVGGTPGIADDEERRARAAADRELARRIRADGVDAFVREWLALPLFAGLPPDARFEDERRRNTAEGLARSLELAGTGAQAPLWDELPAIDVPTLVVAGEDDAKFAAIASATCEGIGADARLALVPGAGHSAHLEAPAAFTTILRDWLSDVRRG